MLERYFLILFEFLKKFDELPFGMSRVISLSVEILNVAYF